MNGFQEWVPLAIAVMAGIVWAVRQEGRIDRNSDRLDMQKERLKAVEDTLGKFYVFKPPTL